MEVAQVMLKKLHEKEFCWLALQYHAEASSKRGGRIQNEKNCVPLADRDRGRQDL